MLSRREWTVQGRRLLGMLVQDTYVAYVDLMMITTIYAVDSAYLMPECNKLRHYCQENLGDC
jgi:hypothetical protein